jgi:hypothetical protein
LLADHEADGHTRSRSASSAADETSVMPTPAPSRPPATHPPCLDQQSRQWVQADAAMIDASHSDDHPAVAAAASIASSWPSTSSLQPTTPRSTRNEMTPSTAFATAPRDLFTHVQIREFLLPDLFGNSIPGARIICARSVGNDYYRCPGTLRKDPCMYHHYPGTVKNA